MPFPPSSRYSNLATAQFAAADGHLVTYLTRRFVPPPENFALLQTYVVVEGDRLDNLSAKFLGDPVQFWRLCDANRAMQPDELTETTGRRLRITLPEGIPECPMLDGIHLTLLIGPLPVPLPAPLPLMEALQHVQVNTGRNGSGFQLTFNVGKTSLIQTTLLPSGALDPMSTRVVVIVTLTGIPQVIMDGVVTQHQLSPSNDAGQSTLTLTGDDLSVLLDVEQKRTSWTAVPDFSRVGLILLDYALYGLVPTVVPSPVITVRSPTDGKDTQTVTDLAYIKDLARLSGYTFYIEPGPVPLTSLAYFGPDVRISIPQPALSVNSDWATNVESLSFSLNGLSKKTTKITILDPFTGKTQIQIPLPNIDVLKPPLSARSIPPAKIVFAEDVSKLPPDEAALRAFGLMRDGADAVSGTGSLNVPRYGTILKARQLVGVRGAGLAYDGLYYVESVTHDLKRGEYKQNFTLSRDGLVSQTPAVLALP